ncbi:MAG TPA: hypothetical protein PLR26_02970 [Bacilli bacterium]|nr:hypothetical protein [Bacilli bacterium]
MKDVFRTFKKYIFVLIIPYLFVLSLTIIPTPYEITTPGGLNKVSSIIQVDQTYQEKGSIHTVYVYSLDKISLLQYFVGLLDPNFSVYPIDPNYILDSRYQKVSGSIMKDVSMNNSVILAYTTANKEINYEYLGVIVYVTYAYTHPNILLGDIITHINEEPITSKEMFSSRVESFACDEEFRVTVKRQGDVVEGVRVARNSHSDGCYIGIMTYDSYAIESASPSFTFYSSATLGPSGGLMQTIAVYNAITESDITKGLKIAGTGTIDISGNVGAIGGAYQKVIAANRNGVDIFFYPASSAFNTQEVERAYQTLNNPTMKIVGVHTFLDAITYLESVGG